MRTLGCIAHGPEVARTELAANAWDAGATIVRLAEAANKVRKTRDRTTLLRVVIEVRKSRAEHRAERKTA